MNLDARSWRPASFFRDELSSGLRSSGLRCVLCPHECLLADGEEGLCHARRRRGAIVETATYAVAVKHLDTIERKPLYHYRPGTKVLTIAAPGCSLSCHYCQNFRLSQSGRVEELGWRASSADPHALIAEARAHHAAIGFSYSEPSLAIELAMDMAALARPAAIDMIWKTNGFIGPEVLAAVAPLLSAANIDIKAADDDRHR
jgi:pyruvate formate lyase activating enzyme